MNVTIAYETNEHAEEVSVLLKNGEHGKKQFIDMFEYQVDESEMMFSSFIWNRVKNIRSRLSEVFGYEFDIRYVNIEEESQRHYVFEISGDSINIGNTAYVLVRQDDNMMNDHIYVAFMNTKNRNRDVVHSFSTSQFNYIGVV